MFFGEPTVLLGILTAILSLLADALRLPPVLLWRDVIVAACGFLSLDRASVGELTGQPVPFCRDSAYQTGLQERCAQRDIEFFVFKVGSALTTASGSSVVMINSGNPCGVAWQIGSSATLGTTTSLIGNLIALSSITLNTGANLSGRALARNGAVTLDTNNVSFAACSAGGGPPPVPTFSTWAVIVLSGLLALAGFATLRRRQSIFWQHPGR